MNGAATAWVLGVGVGAFGLGFYLGSKSNQCTTIQEDITPQGRMYLGEQYKPVVNAAGGYSKNISGVPYFIEGSYPQGSNTFQPSGRFYDWSTNTYGNGTP